MPLVKRIKDVLLKWKPIHQLYLAKRNFIRARKHSWRQMEMIYKYEDLRPEYYHIIRSHNDRELEHQIGRLTNWKSIIHELPDMDGDMVEFGSWRGFSLLWLAYLMERKGIYNKKLVGVDSFSGIPYKEGAFEKYAFSDTSIKRCARNVYGSKKLYEATKRNIIIGKYFYHEKEGIHSFFQKHGIRKLCFVHVDCDVSKSAEEIFDLLTSKDLLADRVFMLFDDYGCDSNISTSIDEFMARMKNSWQVSLHSSTNLTRNYLLIRRT